MVDLRLIVGLGNPGASYARTRHNAGFMAVNRLCERWGTSWSYEKKFNACVAWSERDTGRVLLCQPQTYMNSSGEAVAAVASFYRVGLSEMLVIVDDADLPLGEIRLRPGGGSAGHHGLESLEQHLATKAYARLRVGIGRLGDERRITGYVLGRFGSTEAGVVDTVLSRVVEQAECWLDSGIQKAMSQFNGVINRSENEGKVQ